MTRSQAQSPGKAHYYGGGTIVNVQDDWVAVGTTLESGT